MNTTVKLNTEKDFKKMIEFIAEQHFYKGALKEVLETVFETDFKEEYKYMDYQQLIDFGYDEAEDEGYCNWIPFEDVSEKAIEFFLGNYYINFSSDFDRCGDVTIRLMIKVNPTFTGQEVIAKYHTLMNTRTPIAQAIDNLQMALTTKNDEIINKASVSEEEWAIFKRVNEELEEMGIW